MVLDKGTRLVMIGDSITDCGRDREAIPAGWGSYGDGYVNLVNACLVGLAPEKQIMVINRGNSGDRITDLKARWKTDVMELKPDWVSMMIGINDVWRHFDAVVRQEVQVDIRTYEQVYEELIQQTLPEVKGMIIMSPFMIEINKNDPMCKMMNEYAKAAKRAAAKYNLIFVDVQARFNTFLEHLSSFELAADRVHPDIKGHMIIAKAFLDGIGFEW